MQPCLIMLQSVALGLWRKLTNGRNWNYLISDKFFVSSSFVVAVMFCRLSVSIAVSIIIKYLTTKIINCRELL